MRRRFLSNINKNIPNDYKSEYFTIEALEDGLTAKFSANACEYRIDDGSWNTLSDYSNTPSINKGQTLSFKGNLTPESADASGIGIFTVNKAFNAVGNIMSLLYGDDFEGQTDLSGKEYVFSNLFWNCATLQNAENLILPSTILENNCYERMFDGCTSLTKAPKLPAQILVRSCYFFMFYNCSKLNYINMLATDISANSCLTNWVSGVSSSGTFIKNSNMTSLPNGTSGIPKGWTVEDYIGNSSNLITFTINGTEYQAEEGMTFEEWVLSDYNTSSPPMYIDNNNLIKEDMQVYYVNIFDSGNTLIDIGGKVDFLFNEKIYNGYKIILTFEPF